MPTPLGEKLHALRKQRRMSLELVAGCAGMSKSYLWELENSDAANPTMDKLARIAAVLEVTTEFLTNDVETDASEDIADRAFFRKYQKLDSETKKKLQEILKVIQRGG